MKEQNQQEKEKLLKESEQLKGELSDMASFNEKTDTWEVVPEAQEGPEADFNDLADRIEDYEERSSMVSALSARWKAVVRAIENITTNKYGKCRVCGKKIEADRIKANPAAPTCKEHINE